MSDCTGSLCTGFVSRGFGAAFGRDRCGWTYIEPCGNVGTVYTANIDMIGVGVLNISANEGIGASVDMVGIGVVNAAATSQAVSNWQLLRRERLRRCCRLPVTRRPERCKKIPCCKRVPCRKK